VRYSKEQVLTALEALSDMAPPFEGGCACGQVRYRCSDTPFWSSTCYCRTCQKQGGGASATAFNIRTSGFELLGGDLLEFKAQADSGQTVSRMRCRVCGTWVFAVRSERPQWRSVLAATLDAPDSFVLVANAFVSEAPDWASVNAEVLQFERMPEDELPNFRN
jgi:hypothetical protein